MNTMSQITLPNTIINLELPEDISEYTEALINMNKTLINEYRQVAEDWLEILASKAEDEEDYELMYKIERSREEFSDKINQMLLC